MDEHDDSAEAMEHWSEDARDDGRRAIAMKANYNVWSPNCSSRGGTSVRSLIIHTAEGATTASGLAAFLARSSSGVSYHAVADDSNTIQCVPYDKKSWSTRSANPISDSFCLTGFVRWSRDEWMRQGGMLERTAQWIADRSKARGIPIVKLSPADVAANRHGVHGHVDWTLGKHDGSHTDPGPSFPWDTVISRARVLAGGAPAPSPAPAPGPVPAGDHPTLRVTNPLMRDAGAPTATGGPIWRVQDKLHRRFSYAARITVDGIYGNQTADVVGEFQRRSRLDDDEVVGAQTYTALGL